jgi:hypothetical protein
VTTTTVHDAREHGLTGDGVTKDGNRIWDDQLAPSQTHATWTTERASGATARGQADDANGDDDG